MGRRALRGRAGIAGTRSRLGMYPQLSQDVYAILDALCVQVLLLVSLNEVQLIQISFHFVPCGLGKSGVLYQFAAQSYHFLVGCLQGGIILPQGSQDVLEPLVCCLFEDFIQIPFDVYHLLAKYNTIL